MRLTDTDRAMIRVLLTNSFAVKEIAARFNVCLDTIYAIRHELEADARNAVMQRSAHRALTQYLDSLDTIH